MNIDQKLSRVKEIVESEFRVEITDDMNRQAQRAYLFIIRLMIKDATPSFVAKHHKELTGVSITPHAINIKVALTQEYRKKNNAFDLALKSCEEKCSDIFKSERDSFLMSEQRRAFNRLNTAV